MVASALYPRVLASRAIPAQEPCVIRWNSIVIVYIKNRQTADINFEFALPGQGIGKGVIETMYSLNHQDILRPQRQEIPIILSNALFEIELGKLNCFSVQQLIHISVELLHVHCSKAFKI